MLRRSYQLPGDLGSYFGSENRRNNGEEWEDKKLEIDHGSEANKMIFPYQNSSPRQKGLFGYDVRFFFS